MKNWSKNVKLLRYSLSTKLSFNSLSKSLNAAAQEFLSANGGAIRRFAELILIQIWGDDVAFLTLSLFSCEPFPYFSHNVNGKKAFRYPTKTSFVSKRWEKMGNNNFFITLKLDSIKISKPQCLIIWVGG